mmetsp:Transcript_42399/g.47381  ORF Transcript_42399/g.47381 Transcript_42399/m.47381 type:complete len:333 (-) Transcript_42399:108-1106(-)
MKLIIVALLAIHVELLKAEEEKSTINYDGTIEAGLGSDDEIFIFFIFVFFAFSVSLFGSILSYVSYLDDRIMKLYVEEGSLVEGEVVATEFTRGVDNSDNEEIGKNVNSQKEYFVTIEYSHLLSENYPIRIQKQLRVLEGDFFHQGANPSGSCNIVDPCSFHCTSGHNNILPTPRVEIIKNQDSFFKSFQFDHGKKLELLVLPNHHLSALPARQVERRLSTKYRLFSLSFVIAAILIAVFCFRLAAPLLRVDDVSSFNSFLINFMFVIIALLPIPCIHYCLHELIQHSLEGEYFEMGGEVIKGGQDDSSLSSNSNFGYRKSMDREYPSILVA